MGLGGSSSINSFLFHRPSAADINGASSTKLAMRITYLSIAVKLLRDQGIEGGIGRRWRGIIARWSNSFNLRWRKIRWGLTCGSTDWRECHTHIASTISTEYLSGPLEVGYPALSSGYEKPFVEALRALGINLALAPVLFPYTIAWTH